MLDTALALAFTLASSIAASAVAGGFTAVTTDASPASTAVQQVPIPIAGTWDYVLLICAFMPLVCRRKWPFPVLVVTLAAAFGYSRLPGASFPVVIAPLVALYTVGVLYSRRVVWSAFVVAGAVNAIPLAWSIPGMLKLPVLIVSVVPFALAASLGDAKRSRLSHMTAVRLRAEEAERTREEEAQRRVAQERLRIARELHDVTGHALSIIAIQAGAGQRAVERDPKAAVEAFETIRATSKDSLDELRAMLGVLRGAEEEVAFAPMGRLDRLTEMARSVETSGVRVILDLSDDLRDIPAYVDLSAFRIVQEALTNVVRHARASLVQVSIRVEGDVLVVEVVDDGRGAQGGGPEDLGIAGMRERATALGGTLSVGPALAGGFRIFARLPMTSAAY